MAINRVHVWVSGEVLNASTLNAEFDNIINGLSPLPTANGGTGVISSTTYTLPMASGSNAMAFLGPLTNGQILIGVTGGAPVANTISGTGVTVSAGTITISGSSASVVAMQAQSFS